MIQDPVVIRKDAIRVLVFVVNQAEPLRIAIARNTVFSKEEIQRIKMHLSKRISINQSPADTVFTEVPEFKPVAKGEPREFIDRRTDPKQKVIRPLGLVHLGDEATTVVDNWLKHHLAMVGNLDNTLTLCAVSYTAEHVSTAINKAKTLLKHLETETCIKEPL